MNRVLLIHNHFGRGGGAEAHFVSLVAELRKRGFDAYTFSLSSGGISLSAGRDFVYWKRGRPRFWKLWRYVFHPGIYLSLRRVLRHVRPDWVHLHLVEQPLSILPALKGQAVLHSVHTAEPICVTSLLTRRDDLKPCEGGIGLKCLLHRCVSPTRLLANWYLIAMGNRLLKRHVTIFLPPSEQLASHLRHHGFQHVRTLSLFVSEDYYE